MYEHLPLVGVGKVVKSPLAKEKGELLNFPNQVKYVTSYT